MRNPRSPKPHRPVLLPLVTAAWLALWLPWGASAQGSSPALPGEPLDAQEEVLSSPTTYRGEEQDLSELSVQSRPEGARVFVDGEERGTTPVTIRDLDEGSHEVILYLPDHGAFRQTVEGRGGRIFVDLESEKVLGVGFVSVRTDPPDARIDVDGQRVGLSPLEVPLEAGSHVVRVSKPGFKAAEASVEVGPEERHAVQLRLAPREGALLVISSPVGAEVLVNGKAAGTTWEPLRVEDVTPGTHSVRVQKEGYRPWEKNDVQVRSAETATVLAALQPERDYTWVRLFTAPVNEPWTCPNSSLSSRFSANAPQLTRTKGPLPRGLSR